MMTDGRKARSQALLSAGDIGSIEKHEEVLPMGLVAGLQPGRVTPGQGARQQPVEAFSQTGGLPLEAGDRQLRAAMVEMDGGAEQGLHLLGPTQARLPLDP